MLLFVIVDLMFSTQCGNAISVKWKLVYLRLAVAGSVTMDLAQAGNLRMKDLLSVNGFAFRRAANAEDKVKEF